MENNQEKSLLYQLREIKYLIEKCIKIELKLGEFTMPQSMILCNLAHYKKMKISELSSIMGLTNSTVSGIVDRLENQGLVTRQRCTKDRRIVYVTLNPEYEKKYLTMHDSLDSYFEDILTEIPTEQRASILESLNILQNTLTRHLMKETSVDK